MIGMALLPQKSGRNSAEVLKVFFEVERNDRQRSIHMALHWGHTQKHLIISVLSVGYVVCISPPPRE